MGFEYEGNAIDGDFDFQTSALAVDASAVVMVAFFDLENSWSGRPILPHASVPSESWCCNVLCCGMLPQVYGCLAVGPFVCDCPRRIPPSESARFAFCHFCESGRERERERLWMRPMNSIGLMAKLGNWMLLFRTGKVGKCGCELWR